MKKKGAALSSNPLKRLAAFREALEASEIEDKDYFIEALKRIEAGADPTQALGLKRKRGRPRADAQRLNRWIIDARAVMKQKGRGLNDEEAVAAACAELYPDDENLTAESSVAKHYYLMAGPLREMVEECSAKQNPAGITAVVRSLEELRRRGEARKTKRRESLPKNR